MDTFARTPQIGDPSGAGAPKRFQVLDADPDLGRTLDPEARREASRAAVARLGTIGVGIWSPRFNVDPSGAIGLLVLDGVLARTVCVGGECCTELVGPGDLLRPWQDEGGSGLLRPSSQWEALAPVRVAVLDKAFAMAISDWPEIGSELYARSLRRSRWQTVVSAISRIRRIDDRLLAFLSHLADRWGRVTPEGVVVPLALTHARFGELVGAQRPSVTTALVGLRARGLIERRADRTWLVTREALAHLENGSGTGLARDRDDQAAAG